MIKMSWAVEKIIFDDIDIKNLLRQGLLNRSKYAKKIILEVEKIIKKKVKK